MITIGILPQTPGADSFRRVLGGGPCAHGAARRSPGAGEDGHAAAGAGADDRHIVDLVLRGTRIRDGGTTA